MFQFMCVADVSTTRSLNGWGQSGAVMDWRNGFKAEREATWEEIAQAIHDSVTMSEVVSLYYPGARPRSNRIPCPIHNGKDYNFSFTRSGYKCFVCGASGDVIAFVKDTQGCATRADAMRKLNADLNLHLPIDGDCDLSFRAEIDRRRAEADRKQKQIDEWEQEYSRLMDEYCALDKTIMFSTDQIAVAEAQKRIVYIKYCLDTLPARPK